MLTGLAYLIYYGSSVVWWAPVVVLVIGILASLVVRFLFERIIGTFALSLGGFVAWPVCAYFMFRYVPSAP
jgi:hypothetical protein